MSRVERRMNDARKLEAELRLEGRHFEADIVQGLRKSLATATATLKVLHRDNMALRQRLGLPSFLDDRTAQQEMAR